MRAHTDGLGPFFAALLLCGSATGCTSDKAASAQPSVTTSAGGTASGRGSDADLPEVLASIGDVRITMADVEVRAGEALEQNEVKYQLARHKLVEDALEAILRDSVLGAEAKKQGKTVDDLIEAEAGGSLEPSDVEVATWYQENRARTGNRPLETIRPQIAAHLRNQRRKAAIVKLEERLNQERRVVVNLQPYRLQIDNEGAATKGRADAPVTLVEFSDFQCPFCGRFYPTLKQLEKSYGNNLRIIYRQYPLTSLHPNAFKAAEASLCANEQGKFWELHDAMFEDQDRLAVKDLKETAGRLGLDRKKFEACLDTGRYTERVQQDLAEGTKLGVTGTPALFVNGVPLDGGAVSYEVASEVIDRELARTRPR